MRPYRNFVRFSHSILNNNKNVSYILQIEKLWKLTGSHIFYSTHYSFLYVFCTHSCLENGDKSLNLSNSNIIWKHIRKLQHYAMHIFLFPVIFSSMFYCHQTGKSYILCPRETIASLGKMGAQIRSRCLELLNTLVLW